MLKTDVNKLSKRKSKMKVILSLLLIGLTFLAIPNKTYAQGEAAVPFLLLAPDSRFGALGESGTGLADNSAAIFWNPSGIAFLSGTEVTITHSNWLPQFNLDLFYDYLTFRTYIEELSGNVTASVTYMNFGEFVRTLEGGPEPVGTFNAYDAALTLGYATKLGTDWGIGFNFRIIHSRLSDQPTGEEQGTGVATSVSFDVAGMWRPDYLNIFGWELENRLSIGANLSNIGPKITYIDAKQSDPIPMNFRIGFAFQLLRDEFNSLVYTLDFSKLLVSRDSTTSEEFYTGIITSWGDATISEEIKDVVTTMGLEYWYGTPGDFLFALRSGFFYEDPTKGNRKFLTFGAGLRYDIYGFDFSYISSIEENHPLDETLRFTIIIGWGAVPEPQRGFPRGI